MIEIIYRMNGEEFKEDDLIQVIKRNPFTEERTMIIGRVVKSLLNTELVLDISSRYHNALSKFSEEGEASMAAM